MVILDCEDAVKPEDKETARIAAAEAADRGFGARLCAIRVNPTGSVWHEPDVAAVRDSAADFIVLPKASAAQEVEAVAAASGKPLLAMIETAAGVVAASQVASVSAGLIAGTNDLAADLGLPPDSARSGLLYALQAVLLAARAAGTAAFDGVYNRLDDADGLAEQCRQGRAFGYDGKSLIHPDQIETANRVFSPTDAELAAAERLIAAATGGAERFEGRMIEAMHVAQAQALIAKARLHS